MPKIITENFRAETTREIFDSFSETSADSYYIFASVVDDEEDITNTQSSVRNFLKKVIFGRKVTQQDVRYMFANTGWEPGKVYEPYDDTKNVATTDMFAVVLGDGSSNVTVNESSYRVYKCLNNAGGSPSISAPSPNSVSLKENNFEIVSPDGYIWKLMFEVSPSSYLIYAAQNLLPFSYPGDPEIIAAAEESVTRIEIQSTQPQIFNEFIGLREGVTIKTLVDLSSPSKTIKVSANVLNPNTDSLRNMYFLTPDGEIYDITSSKYISGESAFEITIFNEDYIGTSSSEELNLNDTTANSYSILPKVEVSRSTSTGTRAIAYGVIDTAGTLADVVVFRAGTEYKSAEATLIYPDNFSYQITTPTTLRTIVSPKGGHGSNPAKEMAMSRLGIAAAFSGNSIILPNTNSYSQVGLIKNPQFTEEVTGEFDNRTKLTFVGDQTSIFQVNGFLVREVFDQGVVIEKVVGKIHELFYDEQPNIIDDSGNRVENPDFEKTVVYLVNSVGSFSEKFRSGSTVKYTKDLEEELSVSTFEINTVKSSAYVPYTGDLLHFVDFAPITKSPQTLEKIKFIFDF